MKNTAKAHKLAAMSLKINYLAAVPRRKDNGG